MNNIVTFILLTILLLVSMSTFVLLYTNTQSKTETPPVLTLPTTQTAESAVSQSSATSCPYLEEFKSSLSEAGVSVTHASGLYTVDLPEDMMYVTTSIDTIQIVTNADLAEYEVASLNTCPPITVPGYFLGYTVNSDLSEQSEAEIAFAIEFNRTTYPVYAPAETYAGHLESKVPLGTGHITFFTTHTNESAVKRIFAAIKPIPDSADIGTGAVPVYQNDTLIWFKPVHEKDGCNTLTYLDKATNKYTTSNISACGTVDFTDTTPLYVEYCGSGITTCFKFEQLYAYNLDTGNRILLLDAPTVLGQEETFVAACSEGNFEQSCQADIQTTDNTLTIGVFKKVYTPQQYNGITDLQQPVSFNHQKVRELTINLRELTSEIID